jgi:magnesium transporter
MDQDEPLPADGSPARLGLRRAHPRAPLVGKVVHAPRLDERWRIVGYDEDTGVSEGLEPADLPDLDRDDSPVLWLDLTAPKPEEIEWLRTRFELHPLAIEDVVSRHQRAKLDAYEKQQFLVLYAGATSTGIDGGLHELNVFVGRRYLVTIHEAPIPEVEKACQRWREAVAEPQVDARGAPGKAVEIGLYVLLDTIVDGYFPLLDDLAEEITAVEELIFAQRIPRGVVRRLMRTRKRLLLLRRVLGGERDVLNTLTRRELDLDNHGASLYFLDVYDHLVRVIESLDLYHDLTASALDAHLSVTSFRLNETMKKMTAVGAILAVLTIIPSVYGMNFKYMPELDWQYGYLFAIGLMAVCAGGIASWFRRIGWL